jgi:regulator of replication initiation timing
MLIDPATGNMIDPSTGQPVTGGQQPAAAPMPGGTVDQNQLLESIPGLQDFLNNAPKQMESLDKDVVKATHDVSAMRTDLQGMRRELASVKEENRTLYDRMDNCLQVVEELVGMLSGGQDQQGSAIPAQQPVQVNSGVQ